MLTERDTAPAPLPAAAAPDQADWICYFEGRFVPLREAKVSIMTHAFMYGTAVFEGIRGYWNAEQGQLYALKVREHVERLRKSCAMLLMEQVPSVDQLTALVVEVVRRNSWQEDVFIRPSFYKSTRAIGVRLHDLQHELYIITLPMGDLIDVTTGIRIGTVSWRRTADTSIPSRAKIAGSYVNSAFAKTEAMLNGFDEALVLTHAGHASEGSVENLFIIRDGVLITPAVTEGILEGITRAGIMELARDMGIPCVERAIDRSELYIADEVLLCGTGAQVSPVIEVDRRKVGGGGIGPITARLKDRYFAIVRGRVPDYHSWLTPIYEK